jgi:hypothetical protein
MDMLSKSLAYHQVAPPGYLWIQLTIVKLFGFSEQSLRAFSLITGIGGLFVFRHLAGRLSTGLPYLCAVAVFSVAYPAIRYSSEAKPYGSDLFVGLVLMTLFVEWRSSGGLAKWLRWLIAITPLAIFLSFPAVFVMGGIFLTTLWTAYLERRKDCLLALLVFGTVIIASFFCLQLATRAMVHADLEEMRRCWQNAFPPLNNPGESFLWLISALMGPVTQFPVGGVRGGSTATFVCCVIAAMCLRKNRRGDLIILFTAPLALNLIAAALHRYPFGDQVRFTIYHAAAICFLAGLGGACVIGWLSQKYENRRIISASLIVLMAIGSATMLRDFHRPYKSQDILRARSFAQWFWFDKAYDAELVCLKTDWGLEFSRKTFSQGTSSLYLCNQRIYSPRHRRGQEADLDKLTAEHPLRCALFRNPNIDFDQAEFDQWMASMQETYALRSHEKYPFPVFHKDREFRETVYVDLYEFVPKADAKATHHLRNASVRHGQGQ